MPPVIQLEVRSRGADLLRQPMLNKGTAFTSVRASSSALPALTLLAKRNAGKFDDARVHRMIDGRDPIKGHRGPDMPI